MPTSLGRSAAEDLRKRLDNVSEPLLNLRDYLRSRDDIVFVERPMNNDFDGAYAFDQEIGRGFIYINARQFWLRRRFTMAHELGHHLLHHRERIDRDIDKFDQTDSSEVEANAFASELLMPALGLIQAPRVHEANDVAELAAFYSVSAKAMIFRLDSLQLIEKKLKRKLIDQYDPRFYARFLTSESSDKKESARTLLPDHFQSAIFDLYRDGEITREAAEEALDITPKFADEILPAVKLADC